jgi:hypothetical protein
LTNSDDGAALHRKLNHVQLPTDGAAERRAAVKTLLSKRAVKTTTRLHLSDSFALYFVTLRFVTFHFVNVAVPDNAADDDDDKEEVKVTVWR